jgi:hypothetical protein
MPKQDQMWQPSKSKRNEVARINIVQAQVKEMYFMFILSIGMLLYQEGYYMDCQ